MIIIDDDECAAMLLTEQHHDHEIVVVDGLARWKENPGVREVVDMCDLNNMIEDMEKKGIGRNDERYRRLYRNMGYSLRGYWEVFYWSMNNEDAEEYRPPANAA